MKLKLSSGECGGDKDRGCCVGIGSNESERRVSAVRSRTDTKTSTSKKGRTSPIRQYKSGDLKDNCMRILRACKICSEKCLRRMLCYGRSVDHGNVGGGEIVCGSVESKVVGGG